ncbi:uncharacterized protein LOC108673737 [Hyalella azteca]|uniref:Uncharacterized protein LOC108673737 n=1 Tax=Hyalella azteca TaxID=294128 RepID=A0A8B7NTP3_HYAAZ|nr:uncharacterized protein LOC108673737 [Hyalella azteca]
MTGHMKMFQPDVESVEEFIQRFRLQHSDKLAAADAKKGSSLSTMYLANALPVNILTDLQRRLKPRLLTDVKYEELEAQLISSYGVKKFVIGAAVAFLTRKQKPGESIESYAKVLNVLSSHVGYSNCCRDRLIRDVFVSGLQSTKLVASLLVECENKTFQECVERAKIVEQVTKDVEELTPSVVNAANYKLKTTHGTSPKRNEQGSRASIPLSYKCIRCGAAGKHRASDCYTLKKKSKCTSCSKTSHISKMCRSAKKLTNKSKPTNHPYPEDEFAEEVDQLDYAANCLVDASIYSGDYTGRPHDAVAETSDHCASSTRNINVVKASHGKLPLDNCKSPNAFLDPNCN